MTKRGRGRPSKHGRTEVHPRNSNITLHQFRRGPENAVYEATFSFATPAGIVKVGPRSLGTSSRDEALFAAVERYAELQAAHTVPTLKQKRVGSFGECAAEAVARLKQKEEDTRAKEGPSRAHLPRLLRATIERVLVPAFGSQAVEKITDGHLDAFLRSYRVRSRRDPLPKAPAQSTVGNLNHALKQITDEAVAKNLLQRRDAKKIRFSKEGFEPETPRPWITQDDLEVLARHMSAEWMEARRTVKTPTGMLVECPGKQVSQENRYLLRAYVAVAATTGMRPGTEMNRLRWNQVIFDEHSSGGRSHKIIRIVILRRQGKVKSDREAIAYEHDIFDVRKILTALKSWSSAKPDRFAFARPSDGVVPNLSTLFSDTLRDAGILIDPETNEQRTLYSLRHYYATQSLLRGTNEHFLARVMGTSTTMLDQYYSKVRARLIAPELSGANMSRLEQYRASARRRKIENAEEEQFEEDHGLTDIADDYSSEEEERRRDGG